MTSQTNALQIVSQMNNGLGVAYVGYYNGFLFTAARVVTDAFGAQGVELTMADFLPAEKIVHPNEIVTYERV